MSEPLVFAIIAGTALMTAVAAVFVIGLLLSMIVAAFSVPIELYKHRHTHTPI